MIQQPLPLSIEDQAGWLAALPAESRARFLANLSHKLTVAIRILCCSTNAVEALEQVRLLNESHHRVTGCLQDLLAGDEKPDWLLSVVRRVLGSENPAVYQQASQAWRLSRSAESA